MPFNLSQRSPEEREEALKAAHAARKLQTDFLAEVKEGKYTLTDILDDAFEHNEIAQKLKVRTLLHATGLSYPRADRLMSEIGIAPDRHVRGLGSRQKAELRERVAR